MDPIFSRLSVPGFYNFKPEEENDSSIVYIVSSECPCISDEKFEKELLTPVTTNASHSVSKQNRITRKKLKPTIKIY